MSLKKSKNSTELKLKKHQKCEDKRTIQYRDSSLYSNFNYRNSTCDY